MNEKQRALYVYLLAIGDEWVSEAEVARDLYEHFGNAESYFNPEDYHNTTARRYLTDTVRLINVNPEFEKIIISSSKGIKIANESEFYQYIESQRKATLRKLSRIYRMAKKGGLHNQMDFGGHTVEAFLDKFPETT